MSGGTAADIAFGAAAAGIGIGGWSDVSGAAAAHTAFGAAAAGISVGGWSDGGDARFIPNRVG